MKYNEDKYFINNVLDEKCGRCTSLSCLYLSITERLQLPFYGVAAPRHTFVRYDDGHVKINIETTTGGLKLTEKQLIGRYGGSFPSKAAKDGIYYKNLTKKQVLSYYLIYRGSAYSDRGR